MNKEQCLTCAAMSTPRTKYCKTCGANINRWSKVRPAQILKRRDKLRLYNSRMEIVIEKVGEHSKIIRKALEKGKDNER